VQKLSRPGLKRIAPVVEALANAEGLRAHAESIRARFRHA
jgi:histidinol dehydrogenase